MTAIRSLTFSIFLYGTTLIIGVVCLPVLLLSRSTNLALVRWWCGYLIGGFERIVGVTKEIRGAENLPEGSFIVAAKHQAMWETVIMNILLDDPATILKKELMYIPIFGWWVAKLNMISVDRGAHAAALKKMLRDAKAQTDKGRILTIYPEGTRADLRGKNPYKPGIAALYKTLNVPVIPVALNSGYCWARKGGYRPGKITLEFLEPIEPGMDRKAFMAELETRIETACDRLADELD